MSIFDNLGLSSSDAQDRIDSGGGVVHERTIEIGDTVVAIHGIGSMRLIDGKKNAMPTLVGAVVALFGLVLFFSIKALGLLILLLGVGLAVWNIRRQVEVYLSIGTSDGRSTLIVSRNRKFLFDVRAFLRFKIDTNSQIGATINISNSELTGSFVVGPGGAVSG